MIESIFSLSSVYSSYMCSIVMYICVLIKSKMSCPQCFNFFPRNCVKGRNSSFVPITEGFCILKYSCSLV